MKHLAAVAMFVGLLTFPALAQHSTAHASAPAAHGYSAGFGGHSFAGRGFSGHSFSAPGFGAHNFAGRAPIGLRPRAPGSFRYSGFAPRAPLGLRPDVPRLGRPAGPLRFGAGSGVTGRPSYRRFGDSLASGRYPRGPRDPHDRGRGFHDRDHHHRRMVYWNGGIYPYAYPYTGYPIFTGYVDPWLFGPDDYDSDTGSDQGQYAANNPATGGDYGDASGYPQPPYAAGPGAYGPDPSSTSQYAPESQPFPTQQTPASRQPYTGNVEPAGSDRGAANPAVTVIFKDGRPPVQIHNYLLTATTLTIFDPRYREIPLDQVNLQATEAANQAQGVDFRPPGQ